MNQAVESADKRSKARANLKMPLAICAYPSGQLLGHAVDISAGGLRVLCDGEQNLDTTLLVSLKLPVHNHNIWREVIIKMERVWSRYDEVEQATATGFKFLEIEPSALFEIQKLIDDHSSLA